MTEATVTAEKPKRKRNIPEGPRPPRTVILVAPEVDGQKGVVNLKDVTIVTDAEALIALDPPGNGLIYRNATIPVQRSKFANGSAEA